MFFENRLSCHFHPKSKNILTLHPHFSLNLPWLLQSRKMGVSCFPLGRLLLSRPCWGTLYFAESSLVSSSSCLCTCRFHSPEPLLNAASCPGWCGSVDWVPACNQRVAGLIPSQGSCLGCGPGHQLGAYEKQPINVCLAHWCFSLSLSLSFPHSLKVHK